MKANPAPCDFDADHVRHEVSTVETIAKGILSNVKSDPQLAEELAKSAIAKLEHLLNYIDDHSGQKGVL